MRTPHISPGTIFVSLAVMLGVIRLLAAFNVVPLRPALFVGIGLQAAVLLFLFAMTVLRRR